MDQWCEHCLARQESCGHIYSFRVQFSAFVRVLVRECIGLTVELCVCVCVCVQVQINLDNHNVRRVTEVVVPPCKIHSVVLIV